MPSLSSHTPDVAASTSPCKTLHLHLQTRRREMKATTEGDAVAGRTSKRHLQKGSDVMDSTAGCLRWAKLSPMQDSVVNCDTLNREVAPTGVTFAEAFTQDVSSTSSDQDPRTKNAATTVDATLTIHTPLHFLDNGKIIRPWPQMRLRPFITRDGCILPKLLL
jgi:hypothetical protein